MHHKKIFFSLLHILFLSPFAFCGNADSSRVDYDRNIKKGFNLGALPVLAYDTDKGFNYGAALSLYHYGNGKSYPKYHHYWFIQLSRTTKKSSTYQLLYDSEFLIPGIRVCGEVSYLPDEALGFYGFNGYEAPYNSDIEMRESPDYVSRMYYRMDRNLFRTGLEFTGGLIDKLKWFGGFTYYNIVTDTVNTQKLNKGQESDNLIPYVGGGLYQNYIDWGFISSDERKGGESSLIKLGLILDTKDNQSNPMKGYWTEVQFLFAPPFLNSRQYGRYILTHRHYFTLIPVKFNLAIRVSYQGKLFGDMPFYMLPFIYNSPPYITQDGLGGAKSIRGVLRNRLVGEDYLFSNIELRYKFIRRVIKRQNVYVAASIFADGGMVTREYKLPNTTNPEVLAYLKQGSNENWHQTVGAGLHFAMNENFIVSFDYGKPLDRRDGKSGFYITFDYLF